MRSALLCVLFTLIIHKRDRVRGDDFRPTPIPLDEWHPTHQDNQAGTLHEIIETESPPSVAAVPAHYWEDALRHSVYLTLVRDKIDQLIAKGDVISPNSKLNQPVSKEIDDHDLWEKIKKAPFDRIQSDEANSSGDVTIMAKGRLLENKEGFRFTEDDRSQDKCGNEKCADGVKAFWSVKRVRQRDQEISPGKYHYELTFSVISQIPKKQRKPYENPIRTFTVRESTPDKITDYPHEFKRTEPAYFPTSRPQRAIWFHKNIVPIPPHTRRPYYSGLDRIFSSIFSDDDATSYDQPQPKYRSNPTPQQAYQYSKIGHAGPAIDYHQQSKAMPYPYKTQPYKYARPPLQAPPAGPLQHHYLDYDSSPIINGSPYPSQDTRVSPSQTVKSTRPAVLPTPVPLVPGPKDQTFDLGSPMLIDGSESRENITRFTEMSNPHKHMHKPKPTPAKGNYFPEHIRPPVYNAPPGVFVTMDKKPFKPMPPLKLVHNSKPQRTNKPIDFRPSPQVHDPHSPHPDPLFDTAFRPITVNYADSTTTEKSERIESVKKGPNKNRKTTLKKPTKKNENIKSHRTTTATPDIITAQSVPDEIDTLDWANVLGAFTKTTPMILQTEKSNFIETTTSFSTTGSTATTPTLKRTTTPIDVTPKSTSTTTVTVTTAKPKKRTRPPPKFNKQDKFKKHKRIIPSSTTTTSTAASVQEEATVRRSTTEYTPIFSTTTKNFKKSFSWENKNKTLPTTTTTSTTTTRPTTTRRVTTTTSPSTTASIPKDTTSTTTTTTAKPDMTTSPPRNRNRFRQSTLIYKGTSVKHDKWAFRTTNSSSNSNSQSQNFRRTSNFQGYGQSTTPVSTQKITEISKISTETPSTESIIVSQVADSLESNSVLPLDSDNDDSENDDSQEESRDHSEYIFESSSAANYNSNEVIGIEATTIENVLQQNEGPKNKTKCQKKKQQSSTTEVSTENISTTSTTSKPSTESSPTDDIFQQLFGFNFNSETSSKESEVLEGQSSNHAGFMKVDDDDDDDLTDFMDELNIKSHHDKDVSADDDYEDDEDDEDDDEDESDDADDDDNAKGKDDNEESESSRDSRYESYNLDRPYSFLELMAME